jgi:uncharacterized ParB-like nuclease family protein
MPSNKAEKIEIENVIRPGSTYRVDADKFNAMKRAFLKTLPAKSPGLTSDEIEKAVLPHLPNDLFPGGAKAGWWKKAVQLDLEAKQVIVREKTKPLRWHKAQ